MTEVYSLKVEVHELENNRLQVGDILYAKGFPSRWSFASNSWTIDWDRVIKVESWTDHRDDTYHVRWENKQDQQPALTNKYPEYSGVFTETL